MHPVTSLKNPNLNLPAELQQFLSPALVVSLDAVRWNTSRVIEALGGDASRWRPHLKTTKLPIVWKQLIDAGVRSFKCATTREAAVFLELAREGGSPGTFDLLVAYPHRGPNLARLHDLAKNGARVRLSVLCEDEHVTSETRQQAGSSLGVFIDLNSGMNRTGIPVDDRDRIEAIAKAAGDRFRGLHFYDGHIRTPEAVERRRQVHAGLARLMDLIDWLRSRGIEIPELVTSGTPGFLDAADYSRLAEVAVHRVSPGTVVFHDESTEELLPDLNLRPAAVVMARVVSRPAPDVITSDAGSKSIAAEVGDPCCLVLDHPDLTALKPSEEHLPFRIGRTALQAASEPSPSGRGQGEGDLKIGDMLLLFPRHICPTVNLAEGAIIVDDGRVHSVQPVSARAHELMRAM
jgi:D-serine deaminase-like pyridoxal phosphate-dependent protein